MNQLHPGVFSLPGQRYLSFLAGLLELVILTLLLLGLHQSSTGSLLYYAAEISRELQEVFLTPLCFPVDCATAHLCMHAIPQASLQSYV